MTFNMDVLNDVVHKVGESAGELPEVTMSMINYKAIITNLGVSVWGCLIGMFLMLIGYKIFDWVTPFDTQHELKEGNMSVGIVIASIFIGVPILLGSIISAVMG